MQAPAGHTQPYYLESDVPDGVPANNPLPLRRQIEYVVVEVPGEVVRSGLDGGWCRSGRQAEPTGLANQGDQILSLDYFLT
jgi:hypothetical protein